MKVIKYFPKIHKYILITLSLVNVEICYAAAVYTQQWNGVITGQHSQRASSSSTSNAFEIADDFVASDDWLVTTVNWHGVYFHNIENYGYDLSFAVRFYSDENGTPSLNPFYESISFVQKEFLGNSGGTYSYRFQTELNSPVSLHEDTKYWISILDNNYLTEYGWSGSNGGPANSYRYRRELVFLSNPNWSELAAYPLDVSDRAFSLVAAPLPTTAWLFLSAIGGLSGMRKFITS